MDNVFLTRPNRAARINPKSSFASPFFFGGMLASGYSLSLEYIAMKRLCAVCLETIPEYPSNDTNPLL